MEQLSKLEVERLREIIENIYNIVKADDVGVTWGLEDDLIEADEMLKKALKTKNE